MAQIGAISPGRQAHFRNSVQGKQLDPVDSSVRLEVGTAHRCDIGVSIQRWASLLMTYPLFISMVSSHLVTVGGSHL
jgi:hypothetical protein